MRFFKKKNSNLDFNQIDLRSFCDEDLIDLLYSAEDRLPRAIIDEFLRRGPDMIWPLWDLINDENNWHDSDWAVIHATYIIGALGGEDSIIPLIMSARMASAYDIDWICEYLPSIFGEIGERAIEPLKKVAQDQSNGWYLRALSLESLAAITIKNSRHSTEIFDFIAMFLSALLEDRTLRGLAGAILLDFQQKKYEKSLLEFAEEEEELHDDDNRYFIEYDAESVAQAFSGEKMDTSLYARDWLKFYDDEKIQKRQKRWKQESSWITKLPFYWKIKVWRDFRKFDLERLKDRVKGPEEGEFEEKK